MNKYILTRGWISSNLTLFFCKNTGTSYFVVQNKMDERLNNKLICLCDKHWRYLIETNYCITNEISKEQFIKYKMLE